MDTRTLLRKLVTNTCLLNPNRACRKFSFDTAFHVSHFHYCLCPCAFEYEYLAYLLENGQTDEEIFDRVVRNIVDNGCPHIKHVPDEYVSESGVLGSYLVAVCGNNDVLGFLKRSRGPSRGHPLIRGTVFDLSPFETVHVKNSLSPEEVGLRNTLDDYSELMHASLAENMFLKIEREPILEYCIRKGYTRFLTSTAIREFPYSADDIARALECTFKHDLRHSQNKLLDYVF